MRRTSLVSVPLAIAVTIGPARIAAAAAGPTCAAVQAAFTSGSYESREAIVDALQAHLKAAGADKPLHRDGKVQAILLAVMRCDQLGAGDFMTALDRSTAEMEREVARHPGN